jgi:hypothetical protein
MIDATAAGRLLAGYRGAAERDREAVVAALIATSELAAELSDVIESIDVNPLAALERGCVALDCLVVLRPRSAELDRE